MSTINKEPSSLAGSERKGFSVAASPFNPIKLELGVMLLLALLVLSVSGRFGLSGDQELFFLLGFGFLAALRLVWRIRTLTHQLASQREGQDATTE